MEEEPLLDAEATIVRPVTLEERQATEAFLVYIQSLLSWARELKVRAERGRVVCERLRAELGASPEP